MLTPSRHEESSLQDPTPADIEVPEQAVKTYEIVEGGTQRRWKMLVDSAGYSYTMKRTGKNITLWICSVRSKTLWCKASIRQKGDNFAEGPIEHQHPASGGLLTATKVKAKIKDTGINDLFTSARAIVNNVVTNTRTQQNEPVDVFPGNELLERILNRFRASQRPPEPRTVDFEVVLGWIPDEFLQRDLRGDGYRHMIFATEQMLHILSNSKVWYVNATFKVIREPFVQLFSVHAFIRHGEACKQIPLAFILMSGRRSVDHEMVLTAIQELLPAEPQILRVVMDYEMATWQAVARVFPHVISMGCGFHWVKCLWRKIQELGLVTAYRDEDATRQYCRRLMALLFLPAEHIVDIFRQLRAKAQTVPLARLVTYIHDTWIVNRTWTTQAWSVYNQLVRTNNDVEGWHAMLNRATKRANLQSYLLVELLHGIAMGVNLQMSLVHAEQLTRRQRLAYRLSQEKMCAAWEAYRASPMLNKEAKKLLDECANLMAPE